MSVEKVNEYKEYKKNKKEILEQERKRQVLTRVFGYLACLVVALAFFVMIGMTAKNQYTAYQASKPNYTASSMVVSDLTGILDSLDGDAAK